MVRNVVIVLIYLLKGVLVVIRLRCLSSVLVMIVPGVMVLNISKWLISGIR
jgi:hypothetical protein